MGHVAHQEKTWDKVTGEYVKEGEETWIYYNHGDEGFEVLSFDQKSQTATSSDLNVVLQSAITKTEENKLKEIREASQRGATQRLAAWKKTKEAEDSQGTGNTAGIDEGLVDSSSLSSEAGLPKDNLDSNNGFLGDLIQDIKGVVQRVIGKTSEPPGDSEDVGFDYSYASVSRGDSSELPCNENEADCPRGNGRSKQRVFKRITV